MEEMAYMYIMCKKKCEAFKGQTYFDICLDGKSAIKCKFSTFNQDAYYLLCT